MIDTEKLRDQVKWSPSGEVTMDDKLFDEVRDEIDRLRADYESLANTPVMQEITRIKEKLRVAVESLTIISKNSCCTTCQEAKLVAYKALKEIEGK